MQLTVRNKLVIVHLVLLSGISGGFWYFFQKTVRQPDLMYITFSMFLASLLLIWLLSGYLVWKDRLAIAIGSALVVIPLCFYVFDFRIYFGILILIGLFFVAAYAVEREMNERLHFSSARSLLVAKQLVVFAFSLAVSIGYYTSVQSVSWDDITPKFRLADNTVAKILEWGGRFQPELASVSEQHLTVDQYLRSLSQSPLNTSEDETKQFEQLSDQIGRLRNQGINVEFSGDALTSVRNAAEENALLSGRKKLSELVERPVSGDEQMTAFFSEALQKKIFTIVEDTKVRERVPDHILPLFITLLFFFTVWPIGLLLFSVWSVFAVLIVFFFRSMHLIDVGRHSVEQERLEE